MIATTGPDVLAIVAEAAVRGVLFAGVVGLALTLFRIKGACIRLAAWTVVLMVALAMPILTRALSDAGWTFPVMTSFDRLLDLEGSTTRLAESSAPEPAPSATAHDRAAALSWIASVVTWQQAVLAVYLSGVLVLLLRAFRSWQIARALSRHASRIIDPDTLERMTRLAGITGLTSRPVLAESRGLKVPVTMSVMTPTIVLPATWRSWTANRLDAVLAHELTHVAHRDTLTQRLSLLYRAVLWFSPLSWWLHGRLAELAEEASDEGALTAGSDRAEYAETLLAFFSEAQRAPRSAGGYVAMARGAAHNAERRVDRILNWKGDRDMKLTTRVLIGVAVVAAPAAVLVASVHAWATPSLPLPELITVEATPAPAHERQMSTPTPAEATPAPKAVRSKEAVRADATVRAIVPHAPPQTNDEFTAGAFPSDTPGLEKPTVIRSVEPKYTSDAMRAKLQGQIELDLVVQTDGTVSRVRVAKPKSNAGGRNPTYAFAGYEPQAEQLNNEALRAARQFVFSPGMLNGQPVPVVVTVTISFRLH